MKKPTANLNSDGDVQPETSNRISSNGQSPDPFNAEEFVIDQDFFESAPVKKLLTTVRVKKPNPQDFIRVHPSTEYRRNMALLELKEERESYLMMPALYQQLDESERTGSYVATLYLCVNRQKVSFLWPVRLPGRDGRILEWHVSARAAAETAMHSWVRVVANQSAGAYDVFKAELAFSDPIWPEHSFEELLKIAFKERVIREADHPVLQRLRGAV